MATKYGSLGYLNEDNFCSCTRNKNTSDHSMIINELNKEISRNKNTPFVAHHLDNYEGQFPIWIAVELFSFGRLSKLFSIMKDDDKKEVSNFYEINPYYLTNWIKSLVEVRNICAHYGRLYHMSLKHTPRLFKENRHFINKINLIFPLFLVIKGL